LKSQRFQGFFNAKKQCLTALFDDIKREMKTKNSPDGALNRTPQS
jgi:hypothetical protein